VRRATAVQALALAVLAGGLAFLVLSSADSWADWVVFGAIALTAFGASVAVNRREHPTHKRAFTRSSRDRR
jgi:hypothetical protein